MKKPTFQRVLQEFSSFLLFFLSVGFVVSCCMMLFLNVLSKGMGLVYTPDNIAEAAKITFLNVIIITVLFKTADFIRRKIMVDKPVNMITDAAERIMNGDEISLTAREFDLLYKLLSYPKKTFTRTQLMDEFWDVDTQTSTRTVDVYMTKLRAKLSECDSFEIQTVHGLGYKAVIK